MGTVANLAQAFFINSIKMFYFVYVVCLGYVTCGFMDCESITLTVRGKKWCTSLNRDVDRLTDELNFKRDIKKPLTSKEEEQIEKDLTRYAIQSLYPPDAARPTHETALKNVLHAVSARNDGGYCQGQQMVASMFLRVFGNDDIKLIPLVEEMAYVGTIIVSELINPGYFDSKLSGYKHDTLYMQKIVSLSPNGFTFHDSNTLVSKLMASMQNLFVYSVTDLDSLLKLWDIVIDSGKHVAVLSIGAAYVEKHRNLFSTENCDPEDIRGCAAEYMDELTKSLMSFDNSVEQIALRNINDNMTLFLTDFLGVDNIVITSEAMSNVGKRLSDVFNSVSVDLRRAAWPVYQWCTNRTGSGLKFWAVTKLYSRHCQRLHALIDISHTLAEQDLHQRDIVTRCNVLKTDGGLWQNDFDPVADDTFDRVRRMQIDFARVTDNTGILVGNIDMIVDRIHTVSQKFVSSKLGHVSGPLVDVCSKAMSDLRSIRTQLTITESHTDDLKEGNDIVIG